LKGKKYSDFGGGKKNNLIQFLSNNLMLNSGKKFRALRDQKKKDILTLVLSEKKFLNQTTKNHNPHPLQVKWSVP
jgi:ABC-type phosphonate transport system ATPase subunit